MSKKKKVSKNDAIASAAIAAGAEIAAGKPVSDAITDAAKTAADEIMGTGQEPEPMPVPAVTIVPVAQPSGIGAFLSRYKVPLIVGGVAVAGAAAYFLLRKKK
jgi:hypothetical protein